ncbi:MAG: redoxin domain-containing protein [Chloroflexi bacterium]|nr:redoxin domain-containing protein [Chloroflexota bacterium]
MKVAWLAVLCLGLGLSACSLTDAVSPPQAQGSVDVLASVNGVRLTRSDFGTRSALVQTAAWLATGSILSDLSESKIVDQWVDSELFAQAAAKAGVTVSDDDATREIERLLNEAKLDEIGLVRQLNLVGLTREDLIQYERRALAVQGFVEKELLAGASESERASRLATWLIRQRGTAVIEKPAEMASPMPVGAYAGAVAPNFKLMGLDDIARQLASERGKPVLINFWATWCGPCRREMPAIQAAYDNFRNQGLVVWGVDVGEGRDVVSAYVQELNLRFPILLDSDSKVSHAYRVFGLPTTVFVDRSGAIKDVAIGEMEARSLDLYLKRLLN